ncbi:MAG: YjdF family protein [Myxococcales bacterium]
MRLSVFFDGSLWVGVFERRDGECLSVARVVFGAEPRGVEVLDFILKGYPGRVRYGLEVEDAKGLPERPKNPKRAQREARRAMGAGLGKKAWEAMRIAREAGKEERRVRSKAEREAEEQRKFELRQEKRKEKHRGH